MPEPSPTLSMYHATAGCIIHDPLTMSKRRLHAVWAEDRRGVHQLKNMNTEIFRKARDADICSGETMRLETNAEAPLDESLAAFANTPGVYRTSAQAEKDTLVKKKHHVSNHRRRGVPHLPRQIRTTPRTPTTSARTEPPTLAYSMRTPTFPSPSRSSPTPPLHPLPPPE